ncbi:lipid A export permease/ATP-binding protein MsbA [Acinetobacter rathckeae]|uniref:lipid A export permease/ATP-binding protein MsbA n=1 Tax=Acinetobacter rathckeae TaxID=2605272 RepID=UPI0018A2D2CA|nr:lipid A export permease/ATP-binding protein MsbA [Acinetobacter rathckeae]MBF7687649.1 lipid A export permease/ATP-binding protein MsbA [Acinetobacter rathckeae]MBF7695051.1 lipid A export permease/ATP-binding protein MsbA [Acinetobacter rathckeae]
MKQDFQVYFRLIAYLKPYWGYALLVLIGFTLSAATEVSIAKLLEFIINAIQNKNTAETSLFPFLIVLLIFVRGVGSFLGDYFSALISRNLIFTIREEVFSKLLRLPSNYYLENSSGHITSKVLFNIEQLTAASSESVQTLFKEGLITLGLLGYLLYQNWRLTLVILVFAPLIGLSVSKAAKRMRRLSTQVQDTMGDVNHVVQESILGQSVVKGYCGQTLEEQRLHTHSMANLKRGLKLLVVNVLNTPVVQLIMACSMAIIMWLALRPEVLGNTSAAQFVSFITAAGMLSKPIKNLTTVNEKLQRGLAAAHSVFEILDLAEEKNTGTLQPKLQGNIEFKHVDLVYPDGSQAIHDFNLKIGAGQTVALVGRSGAGKSSLVNLVTRFQEVSKGDIFFDDHAIQDIELNSLRRQVAIVNQQVFLFDRTIKENIAYGQLGDVDDEKVIAAAKMAYIHDFIMTLPEGYNTRLGSQGLNLSGGQRQRIAIARAILKDAPILILDEATSALDNESEYFIQRAFEEAMRERTTIVIAHRLSTIETADQIVVMDHGRIIEQGTHHELLAQRGAYYQLYQRNFEE